MNEHRQKQWSERLLIEKFYSTTHNFILKSSNSPNINWIVDHFTQVKAAEDTKCQRQNPSQFKSYKTSMKQL